jgi:hypothetical protein
MTHDRAFFCWTYAAASIESTRTSFLFNVVVRRDFDAIATSFALPNWDAATPARAGQGPRTARATLRV